VKPTIYPHLLSLMTIETRSPSPRSVTELAQLLKTI